MAAGHPLFTAIVDDAALFPPGNAAMRDALAAHPHHKASSYADVVGRFLCPASRLGELLELLPENGELAVGVIADTGVAGLSDALAVGHADHRLDIEAVELKPPAGPDLTEAVEAALAGLPALLAFVELPREPGWTGGLDAIAAAGRGAKLRTGGETAVEFPTTQELADFIVACVRQDVPFKCTAGLHHAVRHRDETTGLDHHGFLNIALATHAAVLGEQPGDVLALLDEQDGQRLASAYRHVTDHDARRTRGLFVGFGSCSILDPVNDLTSLGLL